MFHDVDLLSTATSIELNRICSRTFVPRWRSGVRQRDVYPLTRCATQIVEDIFQMVGFNAEVIARVANVWFAGLGILSGYDSSCISKNVSLSQRLILLIGVSNVERLLRRLAACAEPPPPSVCMKRLCGTADGSGT